MKIFISGAHGSACSHVKSQFTNVKLIDSTFTCHETWESDLTEKKDIIHFDHLADIKKIYEMFNPDIKIWLYIAQENVVQIIQRIVILDFLFTKNDQWIKNNWCWTKHKHDSLAGAGWPSYSTDISDYSTWCLDEMCQVAYERSLPWLEYRNDFDYVIDSGDLFSFKDPKTLRDTMSSLGYILDENFLNEWKTANYSLWQEYKHRFSWNNQGYVT